MLNLMFFYLFLPLVFLNTYFNAGETNFWEITEVSAHRYQTQRIAVVDMERSSDMHDGWFHDE